jgi:HlyD family secretion protein
MKNISKLSIFLLAVGLFSCNSSNNDFDASGVFEATEYIISAESAGKILDLSLNEGDWLKAGQSIAKLDCELLELQKSQVLASKDAVRAKQLNAAPSMEVTEKQLRVQEQQIAAVEEQLSSADREKSRLEKLVKAEAAPAKQLDDVNTQISVLQKQLLAAKAQLDVLRQQKSAQQQNADIQNRGILSEEKPLNERVSQIEAQIKDCQIQNPIEGRVIAKYSEQFEMAAAGKPLYKIADTRKMVLRAYINGSQLPKAKIGQELKVFVDGENGKYRELKGKILWISDKAEFTPKTIQTKDERANLVYAVKIAVDNSDESIKIGMFQLKISKNPTTKVPFRR